MKIINWVRAALAALVAVTTFASVGAMGISNPHVDLINPAGGENWAIGSTHQILWYGVELQGPYKIEIQRHPRARWQTIRTNFNGGFFDWVVTGPATRQAKIRVTDLTSGMSDQNDTPFTISRTRGR